eukprot:scaffold433_cov257-Pinguiococcus_pyrenoidosus.AAC.23
MAFLSARAPSLSGISPEQRKACRRRSASRLPRLGGDWRRFGIGPGIVAACTRDAESWISTSRSGLPPQRCLHGQGLWVLACTRRHIELGDVPAASASGVPGVPSAPSSDSSWSWNTNPGR